MTVTTALDKWILQLQLGDFCLSWQNVKLFFINVWVNCNKSDLSWAVAVFKKYVLSSTSMPSRLFIEIFGDGKFIKVKNVFGKLNYCFTKFLFRVISNTNYVYEYLTSSALQLWTQCSSCNGKTPTLVYGVAKYFGWFSREKERTNSDSFMNYLLMAPCDTFIP